MVCDVFVEALISTEAVKDSGFSLRGPVPKTSKLVTLEPFIKLLQLGLSNMGNECVLISLFGECSDNQEKCSKRTNRAEESKFCSVKLERPYLGPQKDHGSAGLKVNFSK